MLSCQTKSRQCGSDCSKQKTPKPTISESYTFGGKGHLREFKGAVPETPGQQSIGPPAGCGGELLQLSPPIELTADKHPTVLLNSMFLADAPVRSHLIVNAYLSRINICFCDLPFFLHRLAWAFRSTRCINGSTSGFRGSPVRLATMFRFAFLPWLAVCPRTWSPWRPSLNRSVNSKQREAPKLEDSCVIFAAADP